MWKKASAFIEKFSGIAPMKTFFQYIFKRISNDFLDKTPKIDFKNSILDLQNLCLSEKKINNSFLTTSPYILHSGTIKKLKIIVPSLGEIAQKSIQISISGIQIILKPNKLFEQKFNQKLKELKQYFKFYDEDQESEKNSFEEDNSMDFFKQLIKKILTNIKVKIQNISIRLYMNTPSDSKFMKPQYFSMLRLPLVSFERYQDSQIGKSTEQFEKYRLQIPQISSHLLRQDMIYQQYGNLSMKKDDFPYKFPPIYHPSTIMLIGSENIDNVTNKIEIILKIAKDVKNKVEQIKLDAVIPNIEFMLQSQQIVVLDKFVKQIEQFKNIYEISLQKLKQEDKQLYDKIKIEKRESIKDQNFTDVFSSMVFKFEDLERSQKHKIKKKSGYFDSIMEQTNQQNKKVKKEIEMFTKNINQSDRNKLLEEQQKDYRKILLIGLQVKFIYAYLLKYVPNLPFDYMRIWMQYKNNKPLYINQNIPQCYYMLKLKKFDLTIENNKNISFKLSKIKLLNIKLVEQDVNSQDLFFSMQQSTEFREPLINLPVDNNLKILEKYRLNQASHYCCNQVFSINTKESRAYKKQIKWVKHNFLSINTEKVNKNILDSCLNGKIDLDKGVMKIKIEIKKISGVFDSQLLKDASDIIYPLFIFKSLIEKINLKKQELKIEKVNRNSNNNNYNVFHSLYIYDAVNVQEVEKKKKSNMIISVNINQIKFVLRESDKQLSNDIIEKEQKRLQNSFGGCEKCFCAHTSVGPALIVQKLSFIKTGRIKLFLQSLQIGEVIIKNENERIFKSMVKFQNVHKISSKIFYEKLAKYDIINICIPVILLKIEKHTIEDLINFIDNELPKLKHVIEYFQYLKEELRKLAGEGDDKKPRKKQQSKQIKLIVSLENLNIQALKLRLLMKDLVIYHTNNSTKIKMDDILLFSSIEKQIKLRNIEKVKEDFGIYKDKTINILRFRYLYPQLETSQIILYIKSQNEKPRISLESVNDDRKYFEMLVNNFQEYCSIYVSIEKNTNHPSNSQSINKSVKKPSTNNFFKKAASVVKNHQLSIIDEEQTQLFINISINNPLKIRVCQLDMISDLKQEVLDLKNFIQKKNLQAKFFRPKVDRKISQELPQNKLNLDLTVFRIQLDIFPFFQQINQVKILSNTRSYLTIHNITVHFEQTQNLKEIQKKINVLLNLRQINYYFIYFTDYLTIFHPLLHSEQDLINYGFKRFLNINLINSEINQLVSLDIKSKLEISLVIPQIKYQSAVQSLIYLQNHIQFVIRNFKKQMQKSVKQQNKLIIEEPDQDQDDFQQEISAWDDDEEFEIIDDKALNKIQQDERTIQQKQFRDKNIDIALERKIQKNLEVKIQVKNLQLKKISFVLFQGPDFDFFNFISNPIKQPSIIQVDELGQKISQLKIQKSQMNNFKEETRIRFRKTDIEKFINVKILIDNIKLNLFQYQNIENVKQLILEAKLNIQKIFIMHNRIDYDIFDILKCSDKMIFHLDIRGEKIKFRPYFFRMNVGYTSNLSFVQKTFKQTKDRLKKTFFYIEKTEKVQEKQINDSQKIYELFFMVPQCILNANLHLKKSKINLKVLKNQEIKVSEFFFHSKLSDYLMEDNKAYVFSWLQSILTGNIGSILGNGFINLLMKIIQATLKGIWFLPKYFLRL